MDGDKGSKSRSTSIFDDIFKLQNAAPDLDIDPDAPEDGFKSGLAEGVDEAEYVGPSVLRKKTAIIPDDPKYKGRKASRKELYSDDEPDDQDGSAESEYSDMDVDDKDSDEMDPEEEDESESHDEDDEDETMESGESDKEASVTNVKSENTNGEPAIMTPSVSDDREKGKAVTYQLAIWDDLIKSRISIQKVVSSCNRLPSSGMWDAFSSNTEFQQLAGNVHSSVRKVLSSLLHLQQILQGNRSQTNMSVISQSGQGSDEEITSESEPDEGHDEKEVKPQDKEKLSEEDDGSDQENFKEDHEESEEPQEDKFSSLKKKRLNLKRKLSAENVEEMLGNRHREFQSYRNDTLAKWDEKTRLSHAKIKSKNFAAFDMSVLKQIQQVLANRSRLIRRIHQNRSSCHILGQQGKEEEIQAAEEIVEDDDDEVEVKQKAKQELPLNYEIIDDSDFYHMCLRDLIELKQNEETDPILANKHWLEIQRLRSKHKRKVDTRASKGRKIRYNVKEKLKNYMAPYDKSYWTDEQREDLFKALFGGHAGQENGGELKVQPTDEPMTINLGL